VKTGPTLMVLFPGSRTQSVVVTMTHLGGRPTRRPVQLTICRREDMQFLPTLHQLVVSMSLFLHILIYGVPALPPGAGRVRTVRKGTPKEEEGNTWVTQEGAIEYF